MIMFKQERGQMQLSVVDVVNNGIMAERETSAELVETLREVDEALQIAYERTVSELRNCYVEMLREVNEALRILYERTVSELSPYYAPIPGELNEGRHSQCEIPGLDLWSSSIETLSKPNEALEGVEPFSEMAAAVKSNDLLKEYGSPIYGWAVDFSLN
jgi:hypothetical protein